MALNGTLTDEQIEAHHAGSMSASFIPWLMAADTAKITREWMRLTDHPGYQREDFSRAWVVQFGKFVEPFALDWHEVTTGMKIVRRQEWVVHPEMTFIGCHIDGWREQDRCVIDAKARVGFQPVPDIVAFYTPQLIIQARCTKADKAALLVVHGGTEPKEWAVTWEADYEEVMWERIHWFWRCVEELRAPAALPAMGAKVIATKQEDMTGSNSWASEAAIWLANKPAAKKFDDAATELKKLIKPDVQRAWGHGIQATKDKRGAVTIKEIQS